MTKAKTSEAKPLKRPKTRERILSASLALFNEIGPERATTAEIAKAVGINEGNLYYHFRTKESLLLALFERFEDEALALAHMASKAPSQTPATYSGFLRHWFSLVWAHRFFFRDLPGVIATAPTLDKPILAMSAGMRLVGDDMFRKAQDAGLMAVPDTEREPLLANIWIVSTYWAVYLSLQQGVRDLGPAHLSWGFNQVASLLRPYLSQQAREDLGAALKVAFDFGG